MDCAVLKKRVRRGLTQTKPGSPVTILLGDLWAYLSNAITPRSKHRGKHGLWSPAENVNGQAFRKGRIDHAPLLPRGEVGQNVQEG